MKRKLISQLAILWIFVYFSMAFHPQGFAEVSNSQPAVTSQPTTYEWQDKLKRGTLNIVTSPVEIARSIQITSQEESLLEGWTIGLVKGFGNGIVRCGAGFIDLFTFPFNFPDDRKGPLLEPEYVWEKPGVKYS